MFKKIFILDTNVILHNAESIFTFDEHLVIIPMTVVEEIDKFKKDQNEIGRNARAFSRHIDLLRYQGSLVDGVTLNQVGGQLRVVLFDEDIKDALEGGDWTVMDQRILACALFFKQAYGELAEVTLITKDSNLRITADVHGLNADDYKNGKVETDDMYTGTRFVDVASNIIDRIYDTKMIDLAILPDLDPKPNECFILRNIGNPKQSALVRYNSVMKEYRLTAMETKTCDILPRNVEQQFALELLKDPEVELVSLVGKAGSGKTLMALAAAIYQVVETQRYDKILLLKPIVAMDNSHELGYLPGTMMEKLGPWMASYGDNIEVIMSGYIKEENPAPKKKPKKPKFGEDNWNEKEVGKTNPMMELIALDLMECGSLEHMRGRSLPNKFIIVDETQNLTPHALKTLITRAGVGTKIVLLGDVSQIDSPYLDSMSNGLSICVEKFKSVNLSGHITMRKSERSALAELAANIL